MAHPFHLHPFHLSSLYLHQRPIMLSSRLLAPLLVALSAVFLPSVSAQTAATWGLMQLGPITAAGATAPLFVRNETWTPSTPPANNNVQPSAAALGNLAQFQNFIIIMNNQESYDALLGAYPNGNGLYAYPASDPLYQPQVARGTYGGTTAGSNAWQVNKGGVLSSFPADTAGQLNAGNLPNAPFALNNYIPTTTAISGDPQHGYWQCIYKIEQREEKGETERKLE